MVDEDGEELEEDDVNVISAIQAGQGFDQLVPDHVEAEEMDMPPEEHQTPTIVEEIQTTASVPAVTGQGNEASMRRAHFEVEAPPGIEVPATSDMAFPEIEGFTYDSMFPNTWSGSAARRLKMEYVDRAGDTGRQAVAEACQECDLDLNWVCTPAPDGKSGTSELPWLRCG